MLTAIAAGASAQPAAMAPPAGEAATGSTAALNVADDRERRMTVPVSIAERGPFPFVIDTGAERTVISRELAGRLNLAAGPTVRLTAMSGTSNVGTVVIPEMQVSLVGRQAPINAPALDGVHLGAFGLLGLDALAGHALAIDFENSQMAVRPSQRRSAGQRPPPARDEVIVTARSLLGQLIVSEAWLADKRIRIVLDTGSAVTVGNQALLRLVSRRLHRPLQPITLTSVTGGQIDADYTTISELKVGGVIFQGLPVAFVEVAPFERLGLSNRPALMLGMDALRAFRSVQIDFPNREVRFGLQRRRTPPRMSAAGA